MHLRQNLIVAVGMTVATTVLYGLIYPLLMTAAAQLFFPEKANGQLVVRDGVAIGSAILAQPFTRPEYFHPRPSAAGANGYDPTSTGGTNDGPTNKKLIDAVAERTRAAEAENPGVPVPIDLVTASASGLDPDLSPASALFQVPRVAKARGISADALRALVAASTTPRQFGVLGEPTVNVLRLNLALDARFPAR